MTGILVTVRLDGEIQQQGFRVLLEIGPEGERPRVELQGHLPPNPDLAQRLNQWQQSYRRLGTPSRIKPQDIIYGGSVNRLENCRRLGHQLGDRFKQWLTSDSFRLLDLRLREELHRDEPIRIMLRCQNPLIRHLPWHLWDLVDRFPQAELVLSAPTLEPPATEAYPRRSTLRNKVRILAILGHSSGIDVEADRRLLMGLADADVTFLVEPLRQHLNDHLWDQPWDILFFAGHSQSDEGIGRIFINPQDSLTIEEVNYGLRRAIAQGLQLAIFNSCDGLGLAHTLEHLLPHVIVMREPVPDRIAQAFLNYFLTAFAAGAPLHLATRQARERLQGLEDEFPHASGLPILCQTPHAVPLTWDSLRRRSTSSASAQSSHPVAIKTILLTSVLVTSFITGVRSLGWLQSLELQAFDQLVRLRPAEPADPRILVVTVDEADIQYQDHNGMARRGSLSDQALAQMLQKLAPHRPSVIGLDIFHDFEFSPEVRPLLQRDPSFIAICEIAATAENAHSIAAPPNVAKDSLGFSDIPIDPNYVIRRQFLGMSSVPECPTSQSLSLRVALTYLEQHNSPPLQRTADGTVEIGGVSFPKLLPHAGGYQLPIDEAKGYQILLNYRNADPQSISLRTLLRGEADPQLADLVSDRIVLIGVNTSKDVHLTPYSQGRLSERMSGVVLQAHMVSQIVSAVLDQRPLLRWLPQWAEVLWIGVSAAIGGLLTWSVASLQRPRRVLLMVLSVLVSGAIALTFGLGLGLLLMGWWLPIAASSLALLITSSSVVISGAIAAATRDSGELERTK